MCGIAGLILASGAPPPSPATLSRLIDAWRIAARMAPATRWSAASRWCTTGCRSSIW